MQQLEQRLGQLEGQNEQLHARHLELSNHVAELQERIFKLTSEVNDLRSNANYAQQSPGPKPTIRNSTAWDAWQIRYGEYKGLSAKEIATQLGLSTGQVYSIIYGQTHSSVDENSFNADGEEQ